MQELTPETITDAVLDQMATTSDPRMGKSWRPPSSICTPSPAKST